jgi:hypothetical protein
MQLLPVTVGVPCDEHWFAPVRPWHGPLVHLVPEYPPVHEHAHERPDTVGSPLPLQ